MPWLAAACVGNFWSAGVRAKYLEGVGMTEALESRPDHRQPLIRTYVRHTACRRIEARVWLGGVAKVAGERVRELPRRSPLAFMSFETRLGTRSAMPVRKSNRGAGHPVGGEVPRSLNR